MNQIENWNFIFVFVVGIIGILVGIVLFFENKSDSFSSRLLAGFLFAISIVSINFGLMDTSFFLNYPQFWRAAGWVAFCAPAFSFLYVRSVLFPFKKLDSKCFLLFLPALIYMAILVPLYILPSPEKLVFIKKALADKILISLEPDVILPQGWGTLARISYGILITIAEFVLLFKWKIRNVKENAAQDLSTYKWLILFTFVSSILCILLVVEYFFHLSRFMDLTHQILYSLSGIILFVSLSLLFNPSLLYGIKTNWPESNNDTHLKKEKRELNKLTTEQKKTFKETVELHFNQNSPFLKTGYSINDLSSEVNIPVYLLSSFINEEYQANFNELINDFRIDYLTNLLKTSPKHLKFTLESLGKQVGFSSRSAFNVAIKKRTGKTPSDFFDIKQLDNKSK
jgi:AraC-like DNA-binding protein